jgi:copper oxidase (laccase) domain-containing protein
VGVPASHIEIAGICTVCGGRFFSYRKGGNAMRNMAILSM